MMRFYRAVAGALRLTPGLTREMRRLPPEDRQAFLDNLKDHPKVKAYLAGRK